MMSIIRKLTFRDGKPFIRDTWVWAYTREFAERFHMPEKWIDPPLKGRWPSPIA